MSFYNINNEEISQESILEDLIGYYQSLTEAGKSRIDDFNEGSEARNLLEVLSHLAYNILEEQNDTLRNHFINTADGEYLDLLGANPNVNLPRNQGTTATGLVKFSIPYAAFEEMIVPADITVSSANAEYVTIEDGLISIGDTYTYVPVECVTDGTDGNCQIGEINTCELSDYTVTNDEAFIDGSEFEEDEEYRERLLEFIRADNFGSRGYYENILLEMDGVHDILQNPNPSAMIDYYVNTNDKSTSDSVYNAIITHFSDNNNIVVGHDSSFTMSHLHEISFTATLNQDSGYSEDDVKDFIKCYFKGGDMQNYPLSYQGLDMGVVANVNTISSVFLEYFTDADSLTITNISNTYDGNTTDDFDFQVEADYSAYSLGEISVVFE